jgi:hypothetical protein
LKAWFKSYTFCFTTFLGRPSTGAQQSHEGAPKTVQMTLKDQSFVNKFKVSFVCPSEDGVTFKFWEMLKNALVPKKKYFFFEKF